MASEQLKISVAGINQVPDYTQNFWELFHSKDPVVIRVVPEPNNPYDAGALKITANGKPLGYVPRKEQPILRLRRDVTQEIEGRIAEMGAIRNPEASYVYCFIEI